MTAFSLGRSLHSECGLIKLQQFFLLLPIVLLDLAQRNDLAKDLDIETSGFGFRINLLDILRERLFFIFETLYAFNIL